MPEKQPLVTVITVSYQSEAYLRDAIDSVLAQDYPHIEYLIADDASTDGSWAIIQSYTDSRIRAFRNEQNIGEYPNRNKALEWATGQYTIFIDGDDIIYKNGISYFVSQLEQFPAAGFAVQKNYHNSIIYPVMLSPEEAIGNYYFGQWPLLSSSFASNFFRTEILRKYGLLSTEFRTGDDEIRLRLACHHPVLFVAGWVSWPRETPGQTSSKLGDGTLAMEKWAIYQQLVKKGYMDFLDKEFSKSILLVLHYTLWKESLLQLTNGRWSTVRKLLGYGNISIRKLLAGRSSAKWKQYDLLSQYSPGNPLKRRFLP